MYAILASIVNNDQYGFLRGKSTTTNLLIFLKCILDDFASGHQRVRYVHTRMYPNRLQHQCTIT